jgi:hypothetical protein
VIRHRKVTDPAVILRLRRADEAAPQLAAAPFFAAAFAVLGRTAGAGVGAVTNGVR